MTEATEHPVPRKRGRPRKSEKKPEKRADRKLAKQAEKPLDRYTARVALGELLDQVWHAAGFARVEQADEVIDLATQVHGFAGEIGTLLGDLRRELHIALATGKPAIDINLPCDVVDVMDEISGAAEYLQQFADKIASVVEKERKR